MFYTVVFIRDNLPTLPSARQVRHKANFRGIIVSTSYPVECTDSHQALYSTEWTAFDWLTRSNA